MTYPSRVSAVSITIRDLLTQPPIYVPIPSYVWSRTRRTRNTWTGYESGKIVLFSTTTRFCDIKQTRNCFFDFFFYDDENKVSHPLSGVLLEARRVFLMTFIIGVKSYMRDANSR